MSNTGCMLGEYVKITNLECFEQFRMQWLKLPAWEVGDCWFKPGSGIQILKKQNVSSPLTRKNAIFW